MDPDSLFDWAFVYWSGDSYGGQLVGDSWWYRPGDWWETPDGYYYIKGETEYGRDLTYEGFEDGQVFADWYWDDATGQGYTTAEGASNRPSGVDGLGSEYDWALTASGWDDFGYAGTYEVEGPQTDSIWSWAFIADNGDAYGGTLVGDSGWYQPGDWWETPFGYYYITGETEYFAELTDFTEGEVYTTWYDHAAFGGAAVASGGATPTSLSGLGSELDQAWGYQGWEYFGQGGAYLLS